MPTSLPGNSASDRLGDVVGQQQGPVGDAAELRARFALAPAAAVAGIHRHAVQRPGPCRTARRRAPRPAAAVPGCRCTAWGLAPACARRRPAADTPGAASNSALQRPDDAAVGVAGVAVPSPDMARFFAHQSAIRLLRRSPTGRSRTRCAGPGSRATARRRSRPTTPGSAERPPSARRGRTADSPAGRASPRRRAPRPARSPPADRRRRRASESGSSRSAGAG